MTQGTTATPGEPNNDDVDVAGVPQVPPGAEVLAVVSVVLYRLPDGTEGTSTAAVNADGDDLPTTVGLGMLVLGLADLAMPV